MAELDLQKLMTEAADERRNIAMALLAIQKSLDKMEPMVSRMEHVLASLEQAVDPSPSVGKAERHEKADNSSRHAAVAELELTKAAEQDVRMRLGYVTEEALEVALPATGGCSPRAHTTCSTTGLDPDTGHIQVAEVPLLVMDKFLTGPAHGELSYFGLAPSAGILSAVRPLEEAVHTPFRPWNSKGRPPGPAPVPKPPWLLLGTMHMFEEIPATIVMVKRHCVAANMCVPAIKYTDAICVPTMNYRYADANVQEKEAYYAEYNSTLVAMLDTDQIQWKNSLLLSHALILEFGPYFALEMVSENDQLGSEFVQLEIAWTIRLALVKSWFPSCFAGCDSLYGRDNFEWTIAWSLGSHSHVPQFLTRLPCDTVQHNCAANYHGRWFRFMMGKLTSEILVAIAYKLACAVLYQDSGGNLPYLQAVEFFHMDANCFISDQAECCTISVLCDVSKVDTCNFECAFFVRFNSWSTKGQPSGRLLILVPGVLSRQALLLPWDPGVLIGTHSTDGTRFLHIQILPEVTTKKMARLPVQQLLLPWDPRDSLHRVGMSLLTTSELPVHMPLLLPWNPGGHTRYWLEDKPNFMGEGMSRE